jgi:hypothetical protein
MFLLSFRSPFLLLVFFPCFLSAQADHDGLWKRKTDPLPTDTLFQDYYPVFAEPGLVRINSGEATFFRPVIDKGKTFYRVMTYLSIREGNCYYYWTGATQQYHYLFTFQEDHFVVLSEEDKVLAEYFPADSSSLSDDELLIYKPEHEDYLMWHCRKASDHDFRCKISERELIDTYRYSPDIYPPPDPPLPNYYVFYNSDKKKKYLESDSIQHVEHNGNGISDGLYTQLSYGGTTIQIGITYPKGKLTTEKILGLNEEVFYVAEACSYERLDSLGVEFFLEDPPFLRYTGAKHFTFYFKKITPTKVPGQYLVEADFSLQAEYQSGKEPWRLHLSSQLTYGHLKTVFIFIPAD